MATGMATGMAGITGVEEARFRVAHLDRVTLHYAEMGPEDGPLIILLHGFPDSCLGWRYQMPALAKAGFHVVAPDQRGYGVSGKPRGIASYDLDELADDVIALGAHLGETQLRVVGHDWGATIAWWLCSARAEHMDKAAMINAPHPAIWRRAMHSDRAQRKRSRYVRRMKMPVLPEMAIRRRNYEALVDTFRTSSREGAFDDTEFEAYRRNWDQPKALTSMIHWYRALLKKKFSDTPVPIKVPVLLVWGEKDIFAESSLAKESIALCERGGSLFFEEGTHWVHREEPDRVNDMLMLFFRSDQE